MTLVQNQSIFVLFNINIRKTNVSKIFIDIFASLMILSVFVFLPVAAYADIMTGLKLWYKFDESSGATVIDSSSTGANGVVIGKAVRTTGMSGNAIVLNGAGDYIKVPYNTELKMGKRTVAMWVKATDFLKKAGTMAGWGYGASETSYTGCGDSNRVGITNYNGSLGFSYTNASGERIFGGNYSSTAHLKLGEWAHFVYTFDSDISGNDTFKVYKNGVLVETNISHTDGLGESCGIFTMGSQENPSNTSYIRTFTGIVDDFRVYNRVLTTDDITELYNTLYTPSGDSTAPSTPTGLTATKDPTSSASKINLSWSASTDNVGVTGYIIYRSTTAGGTYSPIASSSTTSFTDQAHTNLSYQYTLGAGSTYYYKVAAYDAAYNVSSQSSYSSATLDSAPSGTYSITVTRVGASPATVDSTPSGISCGSTCTYSFPKQTTVLLEGFAWSSKWSSSTTFTGWTGDCLNAGTGQCELFMDGDKTVTAVYGNPPPSPPVNLRIIAE
jgi:hypothetical protein